MSEQKIQKYLFGQFSLDIRKRLLFAGNEIVTLSPKAFDTLLVLVENRGSVLSKQDLMRLVWPNQFVEENNLAQNIHSIRKSLESVTGGVKFVETIPKRGYRFVADVEVINEPVDADSPEDRQIGKGTSTAAPFEPEAFPINRSLALIIPKTQYAVSTGDVNIAYQVVGDGPLDLVFVMGWVSHLEYFWKEPSFARFLTRLASFSRLILFDKRGTGLSDRVPLNELPTLEQRITDVQAVMDAVGSERAALFGISEGGPMCSLFAATHPDRTAALIMIGTYAKRLWSEDYPWAPTQMERELFLEEIKKNWGGPVGIEERAPSMAHDASFREWWATYLRMGASPGATLALTRMNAEIDIRHILPSIRIPTLVIHRRNDACLPVGGGRYVASQIPGAKYVELDGEDHLPFTGNQDEILDEIEEFLTGNRPAHRINRILTTVLFIILNDSSPAAIQRQLEIRSIFQTYARRELTLFRGKEIEMTDALLFATFDGPARAIRCALAIVDSATRLGMKVSAGLHTGECDLIGEKMSGVTIGIGEAVARQAPLGEVMVSHTVKDLVAGSGIEVKPRTVRAFENLPGEWLLFTVGHRAYQ